MLDAARRWIHAFLRVPPEPSVPEGTPGSELVFRAGRNFYRWQIFGWAVSHVGAAAGIVTAAHVASRALARAPHWVQTAYFATEVAGVIAILIGLPFTFLALALEFRLRWYIVTDRALRVRQGVWNVEELTMTFANIQEIRVTSGPLQNALGLANVEVHAAGGGTPGPHGHRMGHKAVFEGVDNANQIRDLIVERLREYRDSGLGGPAPAKVTGPASAQAVLAEARALHGALLARLPAKKA